jgi:transcriptional regulator with XRE-family HTH domain
MLGLVLPVVEKVENDDYAGQVRLLRLLLGRKFRPMTTEALAALTRIKTVSVRGIEAGRRVLNDEDRRKIEFFAGAKWDGETQQWICSDKEEKIPFDRLEHERYASKSDPGRWAVKPNLKAFVTDLEFLVTRLDAKEANLRLLNLRDLLIKTAKENQLDADLIESLEKTVIVRGAPVEMFKLDDRLEPEEKEKRAKLIAEASRQKKPRRPSKR